MKSKVLLTFTLLFVAAFTYAQEGKQATARIFESQSKDLSRIVLVYETGESEVIPLEKWKLFGGTSSTNEVLIGNQKIINKLLNDMAEKGYEVSKMACTGESYLYTFIVFTKEE